VNISPIRIKLYIINIIYYRRMYINNSPRIINELNISIFMIHVISRGVDLLAGCLFYFFWFFSPYSPNAFLNHRKTHSVVVSLVLSVVFGLVAHFSYFQFI